jgi:hypothetical protein
MVVNIFELWPILLGWPAILTSIGLSVMGIVRRSPAWLVVAACLATPFALYLAASPRFGWFELIIPVLLIGASFAIYRQHTGLAWLLVVSMAGVCGWLAIVLML